MAWDVRLLDEVVEWLLDLENDTYDQVAAAIDMLAREGPMLGVRWSIGSPDPESTT